MNEAPKLDDLPWSLPEARMRKTTVKASDFPDGWVEKVGKEARRCRSSRGWNPKTITLSGSDMMIGLSVKGSDVHDITVVDYSDHPFLHELPKNAPKAVKAIYRKEVRLAMARRTSAAIPGDVLDPEIRRAVAAWEQYLTVLSEREWERL